MDECRMKWIQACSLKACFQASGKASVTSHHLLLFSADHLPPATASAHQLSDTPSWAMHRTLQDCAEGQAGKLKMKKIGCSKSQILKTVRMGAGGAQAKGPGRHFSIFSSEPDQILQLVVLG